MGLRDGMAKLSAELRASFVGTQAIEHRLTKGEMREEALRERLRPHIPTRFALGSGEIVNARGDTSKHQDIIVADTNAVAPFVAMGSIGIFPIECVVATIEVKTRIDHSTLRGALDNVASVKRLLPQAMRPVTRVDHRGIAFGETSATPFGAIVSYSCDGNRKELAEHFLDENLRIPTTERCNALLVLDSFLLHWGTLDGLVEPDPHAGSQALHQADAASDSLLLFYLLLTRWLQTYTPPPVELLEYWNAAPAPHDRWVYPTSGRTGAV